MSGNLILLNEPIKTSISISENIYDLNGQWLPPGNYYYYIKYTGVNCVKGELNCRGFQAEYTFKIDEIIKMMAIAQARLARRASINDEGMPGYNSPILSSSKSYPTLLLSHQYNSQPPHTSPSTNLERRLSNSCDNCSICLEKLNGNIKTLSCKHKFHSSCITRWYRNNKTCPICRQHFILYPNRTINNRRISRYAVIHRQVERELRRERNNRNNFNV